MARAMLQKTPRIVKSMFRLYDGFAVWKAARIRSRATCSVYPTHVFFLVIVTIAILKITPCLCLVIYFRANLYVALKACSLASCMMSFVNRMSHIALDNMNGGDAMKLATESKFATKIITRICAFVRNHNGHILIDSRCTARFIRSVLALEVWFRLQLLSLAFLSRFFCITSVQFFNLGWSVNGFHTRLAYA